MINPIVRSHRLLTATMAFVAVIGWGAYAYTAKSFARRDLERLEAIARFTTDRDGLVAEQQRLVTEQERLVAAQQRLDRELALANAQLAVAREEIALLHPQQKGAKKGDLRARKPQKAPGATERSELTKLIASSQE